MSLIAKFQGGPLEGQFRAVREDSPYVYAVEQSKSEVAYAVEEAMSPVAISNEKVVYKRTVRLDRATALILGFDLVYQDTRTANHFSL